MSRVLSSEEIQDVRVRSLRHGPATIEHAMDAFKDRVELMRSHETLRSENERLRGALEFYAKAGPLQMASDCETETDEFGFNRVLGGRRARQALQPEEK